MQLAEIKGLYLFSTTCTNVYNKKFFGVLYILISEHYFKPTNYHVDRDVIKQPVGLQKLFMHGLLLVAF